jgi:hypothetical protein
MWAEKAGWPPGIREGGALVVMLVFSGGDGDQVQF